MEDTPGFLVKLKLLNGYKFEIDFGEFGNLLSDEPPPLGQGEGPNPARLLAASVANCLAASLLFSVRKFKEDPGEISAEVSGSLERKANRWRIKKLKVDLHLGKSIESMPHIDRAIAQFEDFCVITQSVRDGIEVDVTVLLANGETLHRG